MRLFSDYHTHPQAHRLQPYTLELLQPWVDEARKKGLTDIAFTDHDRYWQGVDFTVIDKLREKNPGVQVRAGIELDNDPETSAAGVEFVEKNWDKLDFVLGSVHYLSGATQMFDSSDQQAQTVGKNPDAVYVDYVGQLEKLLHRGHLDCLSHLDLVKIHGLRSDGNVVKIFRPILEAVQQKGLAIEINTAGWRKPIGEVYPQKEIVRLALSMEIPLTISSDAHSHAQLANGYDKLEAYLKELGVTEVAIYNKHQRKMVPLA